jgi:hypothetical protein
MFTSLVAERAIIAFVSVVIGVAAGWVLVRKLKPTGHLHSVIRHQAVISQLSQAPAKSVILMGDSIIEMMLPPFDCGHSLINAGIGSSRLRDAEKIFDEVLAAQPSTVVMAFGVNDAQKTEPRDVVAWERLYDSYIQRAKQKGVAVVLSKVHPLESDRTLVRNYFVEEFVTTQNNAIERLAAKHTLTVIQPPGDATGVTTDGVHLNAVGYRRFVKKLVDAVSCSHLKMDAK